MPLFREFLDLRRKPDRRRGLPDLFNFAFAEDDHTIVMKDGARLRMFECAGRDLNSASVEELDAHRAFANRAWRPLDGEFAYQIDFVRYPSAERPVRLFPDAVSSTIDHEAGIHYAREGRHHESYTVMSIAWRAPGAIESRLGKAFVSGNPAAGQREDQREELDARMTDLTSAMVPVWHMTPLDLGAMLSHITTCINGRRQSVVPPRGQVPLDAVLGNQDFHPGSTPRVGGRLVGVVSLSGFPHHSHAELTTFLNELPFCYRFSVRGLPMATRTSISGWARIRRNWFQKRKGPRALFSETIGSGNGSAFENQFAADMAADADQAIAEAESGEVRYCHATVKVVITADTARDLKEQLQLVFKVAQNAGFDPRIERPNATDAWLGSIPIHGWYDARKPPIHTQNLADIAPLNVRVARPGRQPLPLLPGRHPGAGLRGDRQWNALPIQSSRQRCGPHHCVGTNRRRQNGAAVDHRRERPRRTAHAGLFLRQGLFGLRPDQSHGRSTSGFGRGGSAPPAAGSHRSAG